MPASFDWLERLLGGQQPTPLAPQAPAPRPPLGVPPEWLEKFLGQGQPAPDPAYDEARKADAEAQRRSDLQSAFSQAGSLVRDQPVPSQPFKQVGDENLRAWVAKKGADFREQDPYRDLFMLGIRGEQDAARAAEEAAARGADKADERTWREGEAEKDRTFRAGEGEKSRGAQIAAAEAAAGRKGEAAGVKDSMDLRKEFQNDPVVKATKDLGQSMSKIRAIPDTGPGDLALIYQFVKTLDPGSAVREGEIVLSREPTPLLTKLQQAYAKAAQGRLLAPQLIKEYKDAAEAQWQGQLKAYDATAKEYDRLARHFGIDPTTVVLDLGFRAGGEQGGAGAGPVQVKTIEEARALPPGTEFLDPNGVRRRR
jgi:hypothetical protein